MFGEEEVEAYVQVSDSEVGILARAEAAKDSTGVPWHIKI